MAKFGRSCSREVGAKRRRAPYTPRGHWVKVERGSCSKPTAQRQRGAAPATASSQAVVFGARGVCPQAFDETDDNCVPHQLAALLQRTAPGLREDDLDYSFDEICSELYGMENAHLQGREEGPVERRGWKEAGIAAGMIIPTDEH